MKSIIKAMTPKLRKTAANLISLFTAAAITAAAAPAAFASESVRVTVPGFKVTLNGKEMDNKNSEYPLIVYKDITYMPMTWNLNQFMGLKSRFGDRERYIGNHKTAFYAGNCAARTSELEEDKAKTPNTKKYYTAVIPEYAIFVNDPYTELDNSAEEYPLLNFRNVTYFPLTWRFAHDMFDWEYSFTAENGLVLDSRNAFRPEWDESWIWHTLPRTIAIKYAQSQDWYVGYNGNTFSSGTEFICRKRGEEEKTFDLADELFSRNIVYLNSLGDENHSVSDFPGGPTIDGNTFTIHCTQITDEKDPSQPWLNFYKNWRLKIDLETGSLISAEEV